MTKKHFIELADMLRATKPNPESHPSARVNPNKYQGKLEQWEDMRNKLADFCQAQNNRFDRNRWMDYIDGKCGPSRGK